MGEESFEHSNNLENLLSPFCYEPETPLPKTCPEVPGGIYLSGFVSQDCTWGCSFNHSVIQCYPVSRYFEDSGFATNSNSSTVAVSSSSYTFTGGRITCATELAIHNQRTSSGARKLLLGISYSSENNNQRDLLGALVIFDPVRCAPMKWIELPEPVSSVTVLSHFEEGGSNRPFFNETMMAMVGIAAVGLRGGTVVIVDLGLDDPNLTNACSSDARNISNLTYRLLYVNPHEYVIATKRHKAVSKRSLISLKFTNEPEDEMISDAFHYCRPNGESILVLQKNSVAVTCIEYVPAIGSLLVGFTCGGFQIWRVNNMELQFSSEPIHRDRNVPVFGFGFQQPVDDPKNFCYVWVMYGNDSAECTSTFVELHSLLYDKKTYVENFGLIYDDFKQSAKRMEVPLIDHFLPNDSEIRASARPVRIWTQPDSELMFCAWEVGRGGLFYLGVFDLNQWYSNHTKEYIVYHPVTGLCPYWVALPIEIADVSNVLLDVRMIPKSLIRWENPHNKQDVHLYPSSLSFRAVCLTNTGVSAFEHFGIQEKLIRIMLKDGPSLMIQPANLKSTFIKYGLEPVYQLIYGDHLSQKDKDRYFILSVLLESRRTTAIIRLANVWLDGSYANVGCTLDLIIDWIAGYMLAVRGSADEHWENLLKFPDDSLPPETIRFVNFSNFAWTLLHKMLMTLMNPTEAYSARGQELEDIEFGLTKLVQYSSALLMLYKAKLLPESDPSLLRNLAEYYEQRRSEAKTALEESKYIDQQYKKSHPLMIDHLMDSLLVDEDLYEEWHVDEGQPLYPPKHIGYLANMFMWTDADSRAVARVFIYFLIDLNSFFSQFASSNSNSDVERKIRGNFKAVMDAAADEYQDIMDLWLLDHGLHDEILVHLKERDRLLDTDGLPWCAATVALTAAGYELDMSEVLLKSCPSTLAKLLFSLMATSPSRYNTLAELMVTNSFNADADLLQQFFEVSDNQDCLGEFIQTKANQLSNDVRRALLVFLSKSESFRRLSQLLLYFVHTQDYQKLDEEFTRVRNILRYKELPDNERTIWTFQESYINHLLSTTSKNKVVENFLRLQSPPPLRQMKCTISVPAIEAMPETPPSTSKSHKLPPQLRKLKLCETITSDPLSPLRRYVGRMQNGADNESEEKQERLRNRRLSMKNARTSLSRSFSMRRKTIPSSSRLSIANQSVVNMNDSGMDGEDRQYNTTRNTSINIDLISILKPPALDHRLDKSRGMSFVDATIVGIPGVGMDETLSQPVQSIMKEKDSSKPEAMKTLRFENLSLSSDDDKEVTIYEDADENLLDESITESVNARFEASFSSAADKSLLGPGSEVGDNTLPENDEEQGNQLSNITAASAEKKESMTSQHVETEIAVETAETKEICETQSDEEILEDEKSSFSPSFASNLENRPRGCGDLTSDVSLFSATVLPTDGEQMDEESESEKGIFTPPRPPSSKTSPPAHSPVKDKHSPLTVSPDKGTESPEVLTPPKVLSDIETEQSGPSPGVRTRSRSKTPIKEFTPTAILEEERTTRKTPTPPSTTSTRRSSRSRTPSREVSEAQNIEETETKMSQRMTRKSRSRTPTREVSTTKEVGETESTSSSQEELGRVGRKSRSTTPTRSVEVVANAREDEPEIKRMRSTSRKSTRATSMTKEIVQDDVSEEAEDSASSSVSGPSTRRRSRVSRSRTPTREIAILEDIAEEPEVTTRKSKRASSSRSTTPTRDLPVSPTDESPSGKSDVTKPVRRSTRTAKPLVRELYEDYDEEESVQIALRRSLRTSRSRTPTRDIGGVEIEQIESVDEQPSTEKIPRRTLRATRSVTPSRDVGTVEKQLPETNEEEETAEERQSKPRRASRSRTPSREVVTSEQHQLETIDEEETTDKKQKRTARATRSTTPSRDLKTVEQEQLETIDEEETTDKKQKRPARATRSTTPSRDIRTIEHEQMETIDEEETTDKKQRRPARSTRSTTPSRDIRTAEQEQMETISEEETTDKKQRKPVRSTRSTTPTRDLVVPEPADDSSAVRRSSRRSRSRTPTRDKEAEISPTRSERNVTRTKASTEIPLSESVAGSEESEEVLKPEKKRKKRKKAEAEAGTSSQSQSQESFTFETSAADEDYKPDDEEPSTSKGKTKPLNKPQRTTKRRLKYFEHHQDLSTLIEDSLLTDPSVMDSTVLAPTVVEPPKKNKRIKGIRQKSILGEEESETTAETESVLTKPTKRRKKAAVIMEDLEEDIQSEVESHVSLRSNRSSASSRRSTASGKGKRGRRGKSAT